MSSSPEQLSPVKASLFPTQWYQHAPREHFWMQWRMMAFDNLVKSHPELQRPGLCAMDVGAGHCEVASTLERKYGWVIDAVDLNEGAFDQSAPLRGRKLYYNLLEQNPALLGRYDVILLFDLLEHIEEPRSFLKAAAAHLRPGGVLVANLPAGEYLRSRYDEICHHFRRYRRSLLTSECGGKWDILEMNYWGLSLIPLLLMRRLVLSLPFSPEQAGSIGFKEPHWIIDAVIRLFMRAETAWLKRPFAGTSLMALLRKPHTAV